MIDCQKIAKNILKGANGGSLAILYDVANPAANSYVAQLTRTATDAGVEIKTDEYSHQRISLDIHDTIDKWNRSDIDGIILVSPSAEHYECVEYILRQKRVEGNDFDDNMRRVSCAARACVEIISSVTSIEGKNVLIIGYGKAVGKPLSYLLMRKHVGSVTTTHKYTMPSDLLQYIHRSDIIVSAVGKPHFIRQCNGGTFDGSPITGKVLIDAGISIVNGKVTGDLDPELAEKNQLSPVPGGVGPVTTALLLRNVSLAAKGRF